jgi:peptidylprolyl isomerase
VDPSAPAESPSPTPSKAPSPYLDPPKDLQVEVVDGFTPTGDAVKPDNVVAVNISGWVWGTLEPLPVLAAYAASPLVFPVRSDTSLSALSKAVVGQKIGTRVMAVVPQADSNLNTTLGAEAGDTLTVVIDILAQYPKDSEAQKDAKKTDAKVGPVVTGALGAPATITVPGGVAAPEKVTTTILATGTGAPIQEGDTVIYNYAAVDWNGTDGGSTWTAGLGPSSIERISSTLDAEGKTVDAFSGLIGIPIGSRVLVETPGKKNSYAAEAIVMDLIAVAPNSLVAAPAADPSATATPSASASPATSPSSSPNE